MNQTYYVHNENETWKIAEELAKMLNKGDIVCLYGELGAGKTTFCKAAIKALGVRDHVTSPTFTIIHEYMGTRFPIYHFDVYRIQSEEQMEEIGYEEYFFGEGICFVEWAALIEGLIPSDAIHVTLHYAIEEEEGRRIDIEYPGD